MRVLLDRLEINIQKHALLHFGSRVLVAVSGGVDSMVLLQALHGLSRQHGFSLVVAHLNHQLRGRASRADEQLVRRTAAKLKLPVIIGREDVRALAMRSGISIEMAARDARHRFLARAARSKRIGVIAVAHHADDQVELFFLRLLRGAGGDGLAGMDWNNPSPIDPRLRIIRPLLDISKVELARYAAAEKIPFREDATNADRDILRNRIRHELLPFLRKRFQPALDRTVARVMEIVGAEADVVGRLADGSSRTGTAFASQPIAVQRRRLQTQLLKLGVASDFELIEKLRERLETSLSVARSPGIKGSGPWSVSRDNRGLVRLKKLSRGKAGFDSGASLRLELGTKPGKASFAGFSVRWRIRRLPGASRRKSSARMEEFDADKVGPSIVLRHWRAGDRFQPIGMGSPVKLQDLFVNARIPREERHALVVAEADGELFWVEKLRISERFKLTPGTIRRLHWRWNRA